MDLSLVVLVGHGGGHHYAEVGDRREADDALDVEIDGVVVLLDNRLAGNHRRVVGEDERGQAEHCKHQEGFHGRGLESNQASD